MPGKSPYIFFKFPYDSGGFYRAMFFLETHETQRKAKRHRTYAMRKRQHEKQNIVRLADKA
jgi:hypothetical protein